ncbi:MAG: Mpv17/PMP22 family protein [Halopseudomonas sp.]
MLIKSDFKLFLPIVCLLALAELLDLNLATLVGGLDQQYPLISAFVKFALLGTLGEVLGLRLSTGGYPLEKFGLIPKAITWGIMGVAIKIVFVIFASGVPALLVKYGIDDATSLLSGSVSAGKLIVAFSISVAMNVIFSPLLMTLHKITDLHIQQYQGSALSLIRPISVGRILNQIDWQQMWSFVFKKTIPFFWIPAHTLTFLLPPEHRVLFAALLGVMLGIILVLPGRGQPSLARA